jgi:hypothetical protein
MTGLIAAKPFLDCPLVENEEDAFAEHFAAGEPISILRRIIVVPTRSPHLLVSVACGPIGGGRLNPTKPAQYANFAETRHQTDRGQFPQERAVLICIHRHRFNDEVGLAASTRSARSALEHR